MNRKILYGYHIQDGALTIQPQEAEVVKRIFAAYLSGTLQRKISDDLNADGLIYSQSRPEWTKYRISFILKNPRYMGADGYPALLDSETFQTVQQSIRKQRGKRTVRDRPVLCLRDRLYCQRCGGRLKRIFGGNSKRPDTLYLQCEQCGSRPVIPDDTLLAEIERQAAEYTPTAPATAAYAPSGEVVRLTNAINRGLEHPEQPEEVVSLILQGISARYDCLPSETPSIDLPRLLQEERYEQAIQSITISADSTVSVTFKQPQTYRERT